MCLDTFCSVHRLLWVREGKKEEGEFISSSNTCLFSFPGRKQGEGAGLGEVILTLSPSTMYGNVLGNISSRRSQPPPCPLHPCRLSQPGPTGFRGQKAGLRNISAARGSISPETISLVFKPLQAGCRNHWLLLVKNIPCPRGPQCLSQKGAGSQFIAGEIN